MKKHTVLLMILGVLTVFALTAGTGIAGRNGGPQMGPQMGGPGWGGFDFLNILTDTQKPQAAAILAKYIDAMKAQNELITAAHTALEAAIQSDTFSEDAVRQAYRNIESVRTSVAEEMAVIRAKIMNEMKSLLTADQLALLSDRAVKFAERMEASTTALENWIKKYTETTETTVTTETTNTTTKTK